MRYRDAAGIVRESLPLDDLIEWSDLVIVLVAHRAIDWDEVYAARRPHRRHRQQLGRPCDAAPPGASPRRRLGGSTLSGSIPVADQRRLRIAYLTYSSGQYDARTLRMARTARAAGYDVTVYARWYPGLPVEEDRDGCRIVRAPNDWHLAVPGLRGGAWRRAHQAMRLPVAAAPVEDTEGEATEVEVVPTSLPSRIVRRIVRPVRRPYRRWRRILLMFPLLGWDGRLPSSGWWSRPTSGMACGRDRCPL